MNLERLRRITVEPGKCGGRPCIRGQRIRVSDVMLELLSNGASHEEILRDYPSLESEDILAVLEYAAPNGPRGPAHEVKFLIDNQLPRQDR